MALQLDTIRATAQRVAASHNLDLVDLEFQGGAKHRTLRIFIEKNAQERAKLAGEELPKDVPTERLSGVTHEDCTQFAQDFGTVLDVEDLIPGRRIHPRSLLPGPRTQAVQTRGFHPFRRQPDQAPDLHSGQQQPPVARPLNRIFQRSPDPRPLCHQAEGQGQKKCARTKRRNRLEKRRKSKPGRRDLVTSPQTSITR